MPMVANGMHRGSGITVGRENGIGRVILALITVGKLKVIYLVFEASLFSDTDKSADLEPRRSMTDNPTPASHVRLSHRAVGLLRTEAGRL